MKPLLPIGSVVLLKGGQKRLMVCGRVQTDTATGKTYDYSGCFYPDGIVDSTQLFLFDNENVQKVFFIGFQDPEEFAFRDFMKEQLEGKSQE